MTTKLVADLRQSDSSSRAELTGVRGAVLRAIVQGSFKGKYRIYQLLRALGWLGRPIAFDHAEGRLLIPADEWTFWKSGGPLVLSRYQDR